MSISSLLITLTMIAWIAALCAASTVIPCDDPNFGLSPYTWKCTGTKASSRAEATMPGAYLKVIVKGTTTVNLLVDGAANDGCPAPSMPFVEYSLDDGPFEIIQLQRTGEVYSLPIAGPLDPSTSHKLKVYFRASDLIEKRWTSSATHLRIAGISVDEGGTIAPYQMRPKKAIGFGDSITEGVGVDGLFTSWHLLGVNNARGSWFPLVCAALDCEYGQLGSGGLGMVKTLNLPPLPEIWDHYDSATSRLKDGHLLPEPDYVFCCLGTNDFDLNITESYIDWLAAVRKACPHARIFCVVPPSGIHRGEVQSAVEARNKVRDSRVYLIDIPLLNAAIRTTGGATQMTYDGVHPSMYGSAVFGASVAVKAQAILSREECK